jgi:hypothetical protein
MVEQNPALSTLNYRTGGAIDYKTGSISISSIIYDSVIGGGIKFYAVPQDQDVYASKNQILEIDTSIGVAVTVVDG